LFGGGFESNPVEDTLVPVVVVDESVLTVLVEELVEGDIVEELLFVEVVVTGELLALEEEGVVVGEPSWFA